MDLSQTTTTTRAPLAVLISFSLSCVTGRKTCPITAMKIPYCSGMKCARCLQINTDLVWIRRKACMKNVSHFRKGRSMRLSSGQGQELVWKVWWERPCPGHLLPSLPSIPCPPYHLLCQPGQAPPAWETFKPFICSFEHLTLTQARFALLHTCCYLQHF